MRKCRLLLLALAFSSHVPKQRVNHCRPVERLLWGVVNVAWVFPIFFLAKVINATYFQEVADAAFRFLRGTAQPVAPRRE